MSNQQSGFPTIEPHRMSSNQLQRAWALMLVCSLFPTIKHDEAQPIARWIFDNSNLKDD